MLAGRRDEILEAAEPFFAIEAAERLVADRLRMLDQALAEPCTGFGRGQGLGSKLVAPQAVHQRLRLREQAFECVAATAADDVVRVLAGRKLDEAQGALGTEQGQGA